MNTLIRNLALAGLLALSAGAASAGVTVKYIEPRAASTRIRARRATCAS